MFDSHDIDFFIYSFIFGLIMGILLGCGGCHGAENPNPYKPMGSSTTQEIKIKQQMFKACVSSGESRARCYRIYYGN